jgi:hypothetical protein
MHICHSDIHAVDKARADQGIPSAGGIMVEHSLLDKLRSTSARNRRGRLALVRTLTEKGDAPRGLT